jgi:hypothetical protein
MQGEILSIYKEEYTNTKWWYHSQDYPKAPNSNIPSQTLWEFYSYCKVHTHTHTYLLIFLSWEDMVTFFAVIMFYIWSVK